MGINVGDVIVDGDDIYGDGVNIAARLEAYSEPGKICVSTMVREGVRGKINITFDDLGEQSLKNIAEPVRIYSITPVVERADAETAGLSSALLRRPAVAVLPFQNLGGDPEQEFLADGLTEDIITALSLWRSFPVIARNSTFAFKGQSPDIRKVGEVLGARYVIEGSIRKAGNRIRVSAQLINADTGHHVWAERYDRELTDIFELQDEITTHIVAMIAPEMERAEQKLLAILKPRDMAAWEYVQRGMAYVDEYTGEGHAKARNMFEKAIEADPGYSKAFAGLAMSHTRDLLCGTTDARDNTLEAALAAARRAVELDQSDSWAHHVLGTVVGWIPDYDLAISEEQTAIRLNPSLAGAYGALGAQLTWAGRPDEAIPVIETLFRVNPQESRNHMAFSFMAMAHLIASRRDEAVDWARKAVQWKSNVPFPHLVLASCLGNAGKSQDANVELVACDRIQPGFTGNSENWHRFQRTEDNELFLDGLRKAGWAG